MYRAEDKDQLVIEDFHMPFAGKLDPNNRWVRLSKLMPWEKIEEIYLQMMSIETGREAISARIAFGAIFIRESERYTDKHIVTALQENPYIAPSDRFHSYCSFGMSCSSRAPYPFLAKYLLVEYRILGATLLSQA